METIFQKLTEDAGIHARWLNTLSMMENAGAKKIKKCEHPVLANEIILKHAAEEARHAYYLKKQIKKIANGSCPTYEKQYLLAPNYTYYYLHTLDIQVCKFLKKNFSYSGYDLKYAAYLLVTYAIEVRADDLYPQYQKVLTAMKSPVNVKSIIAEEINHLQEMRHQLKEFSPRWEELCQSAVNLETKLFNEWVNAVQKEIAL
jgi:hypothetical protein